MGGEMQLLAGLEIELVDHPDDGLRCGRTQRLRHGPQGFFAVRGFDQDHAGRIEAKAVEPVSGKPAKKTAIAPPSAARHDEDERTSPRQASHNRNDEAEGGRAGAFRLGHDLMQGAAGQAARRQISIKRGKTERQGLAPRLPSWQQTAQFRHHGDAAAGHGKGNGF
jgi:hypothetical protein